MKKHIIWSSAVLLAGTIAFAPAYVSARKGADDSVTHQSQIEDKRWLSRKVEDTTHNEQTQKQREEDNPTSITNNGIDLRGDGTPEDNSNAQTTQDRRGDGTREDHTISPPSDSQTVAMSSSEAITKAQNRLPYKEYKKVESDTEHGVAVWSVRFQDGSRVDIAKTDGSIVRVRNR